MRDTIFDAIVDLVEGVTKFQGGDGSMRVYDFPPVQPSGYPYAVVSSDSLESSFGDNMRDRRLYNFLIAVVGEKFGEQSGLSQSQALKAMRETEDAIMTAIDANNDLGVAGVIYSLPTNSSYGYSDGGSRVALEIKIQVNLLASVSI